MKRLFIIGLILCLVWFTAGCESMKEDGRPKVMVILKTLSSQYWKFVEAGAKEAAKKLNVDVTIVGPSSEAKIDEQISLLEDAITQEPDALVVSPSQPVTVIPAFEMAKKKKIPVLLVDTDADWDDKVTFLGTDNYTAGKKGGEQLASMLKPGDKVAIIAGALGNTAMDHRVKGAKEVLQAKGIKVVAEQPADSDKEKALSVMENILQKNPDIKGVFSANDDMAIGALRALEARKLKIPVIGTDGTIEALESIQAGNLSGTIAQNPYQMGYKGVETALKAIRKEKVSKRIDTGVDVITRKNAQKKMNFLKGLLD
ncbi:sugar ABC transporter substrate-binding protein [Thermoflavimicrobium dichotomicum]|uniref:Ribose transport system substrate-binding protein n=1 Tax=Thermoflavimicrobium dichotomicum TaxID=46223 RepID=A0A1I3UYJ7_9BACL|nr:sugar ABC transporter substrate-binding protein [Thermoflavimicrobium dichotomicum]SFJ88268.1 ribose transport system substrate-binding protein [Thermoflavimicrobium dichotomicum]